MSPGQVRECRTVAAEWIAERPDIDSRQMSKDLVREASHDIGRGDYLAAYLMLEAAIQLRRRNHA